MYFNTNGKVKVNWNNLSNSNPRIGVRKEVLAYKHGKFIVVLYFCKDFNQPFSCLDVSMRSPSVCKYIFWSIILSSYSVRTKCFRTSSDVRARLRGAFFCNFGDSEAVMISASVRSAIRSISACIPSLFRLVNLFPV